MNRSQALGVGRAVRDALTLQGHRVKAVHMRAHLTEGVVNIHVRVFSYPISPPDEEWHILSAEELE